jgi:hypothetical protein
VICSKAAVNFCLRVMTTIVTGDVACHQGKFLFLSLRNWFDASEVKELIKTVNLITFLREPIYEQIEREKLEALGFARPKVRQRYLRRQDLRTKLKSSIRCTQRTSLSDTRANLDDKTQGTTTSAATTTR